MYVIFLSRVVTLILTSRQISQIIIDFHFGLADLYRDQRLPSCQIVAVSPCGRRWQQFAGVAPPGKDQRPSPRAGGPATPLTSRRESRAADAKLFASKSCSLSPAFAAKCACPSGPRGADVLLFRARAPSAPLSPMCIPVKTFGHVNR